MMDDKISRYTRLGLLEKLAGAGLKDKNGNKLTTKEDIINEMEKLDRHKHIQKLKDELQKISQQSKKPQIRS